MNMHQHKRGLLLFLAIIVIGGAALLLSSGHHAKPRIQGITADAPLTSPPGANAVVAPKEVTTSSTRGALPVASGARPGLPPEVSTEQRALNEMTGFLVESLRGHSSPQALLKELAQHGMKPLAAQNFNPQSGKMVMIRTQEALPGTRYFHAQFFEGTDKNPYLQHMSFEIKPGPEAMDMAIKTLRSQIADLGQPSAQADGYVLWKIPDGHIVWVKRLGAEDLKYDPFNAYSSEDIGTVRVTAEIDIHAHDEDAH